jgi:hypothetical protein
MSKVYSITEYVSAAEDRIRDFAKAAGENIGGFTMTAIHKELKTMFEAGMVCGKDEKETT